MAIIPPEQFNTSFGKVSVSHQSFRASINIYTSPKPPSSLRVGKIDFHSISITWVAPKIVKDSTIAEFLVKYVVLNNEGNSSITGTEKIRSAQRSTSFLITDLAMGTLYGISVAVTTIHILLRLRVTQNGLQLPLFFFLIPNAVFGRTAKRFLAGVLELVTLEACDQNLTHSLDTPKNISVKIVPQVVIRDAFGT